MTAERISYTGTATQTPNPAKPRPLSERIPLWFGLHATGWICTHPHGPDDVTEELGHPEELVESYALRHLNDHHPGWETAPALCAAPCPHGHDHACARSPKHTGFHRDVKQKGHESCSWTGDETGGAAPAARPDLDAILNRAASATPGPWVVGDEAGLHSHEVVISPTGRMVGLDWDPTGADDAAFIAHAREDVPALLTEIDAITRDLRETQENLDRARARLHDAHADIDAANQVAADALNRSGSLTADLNAARTEVNRLRRLLDTRDAEYALVVRVGADGRAQVDSRNGITIGQCATWLREIATDTIRRALR